MLLATRCTASSVFRPVPAVTPRSHRGRALSRTVQAAPAKVCAARRRTPALAEHSREGIDAIFRLRRWCAEPPQSSMTHFLPAVHHPLVLPRVAGPHGDDLHRRACEGHPVHTAKRIRQERGRPGVSRASRAGCRPSASGRFPAPARHACARAADRRHPG